MNIAAYIDHTILKPTTTEADIRKLCAEALEHSFAAVCVPPFYVSLAAGLLRGRSVKTATVIGFPFGYSNCTAKLAEATKCINDGAEEFDIVHNLAALKNGDWDYLYKEAEALCDLLQSKKKVVKMIIESGELTDEEIRQCCRLYAGFGIDFMKTSTGYAASGASVHAVKLMRAHLPESVQIKASGGIRNFAFAEELIDAGATRIGCSASLAIVEESKKQ